MTGIITNIFIAVLACWAIAGLAGYMVSVTWAMGLGAAVALTALVFARNPVSRGIVALLDPLGIVLPLLALRHIGGWLGVEVYDFSTGELILFLTAYILFLAASTGKLPFDPYRLGYAPLPVALLTLSLCAIGAAQGSLFLPVLAVLAQLLWLLRWGSSNYFDHILHAALVPIVVIDLIGRFIA